MQMLYFIIRNKRSSFARKFHQVRACSVISRALGELKADCIEVLKEGYWRRLKIFISRLIAFRITVCCTTNILTPHSTYFLCICVFIYIKIYTYTSSVDNSVFFFGINCLMDLKSVTHCSQVLSTKYLFIVFLAYIYIFFKIYLYISFFSFYILNIYLFPLSFILLFLICIVLALNCAVSPLFDLFNLCYVWNVLYNMNAWCILCSALLHF